MSDRDIVEKDGVKYISKQKFTGHGWRTQGRPGCFAPCPKPHHENIAIGQVETTYPWRCERIKGHKGWHCCDNGSWE